MGVFMAIVASSGWFVALAICYWHRWVVRQLREQVEWYADFASKVEHHRNKLLAEKLGIRE